MRELLKKGYRMHITVVMNLYGAMGLAVLLLYGTYYLLRDTWQMIADLIK